MYYLQHCNYYRLSGYFYHFKDNKSDNFKDGTSFSFIIEAYKLDKKIRTHLLDLIETFEISLRSNFAYLFSEQKSKFLFEDKSIYRSDFVSRQTNKTIKPFDNIKLKIESEFARSTELFAKHMRSNYQSPPIWMLVEIMSLGTLSSLYKNMKLTSVKKALAKIYHVKSDSCFESILHHLSIVRNICAHHGRLWKRNIDIQFQIPKGVQINNSVNSQKLIYNSLILLKHLFKDLNGTDKFKEIDQFFSNLDDDHKAAFGVI